MAAETAKGREQLAVSREQSKENEELAVKLLTAHCSPLTGRQAIIAAALEWRGTPFHHEAMVKGAGVDCGMLLIAVYREAGLIPDFPVAHYSYQWHLHRSRELYLEYLRQFGREIPEAERGAGDVVIWKLGRVFSHAAIIIAWPHVIHAVNGRGVIFENVDCALRLRNRPRKFFSPFKGSKQ